MRVVGRTALLGKPAVAPGDGGKLTSLDEPPVAPEQCKRVAAADRAVAVCCDSRNVQLTVSMRRLVNDVEKTPPVLSARS
jgi:hypothetical protein